MAVQGSFHLVALPSLAPLHVCTDSFLKEKEREGLWVEKFLGTRPGNNPYQLSIFAQEGKELGLNSQPVSATLLW